MPTEPPDKSVLIFPSKFMLPNTEDNPAARAQQFGCMPVSSSIPCDFLGPILNVGVWTTMMVFAPVPKTPIDKDCQAQPREDEIRPTVERISAPPSTGTNFRKEADETLLSRPVP